jgi:hypothetical protein
MSFFVFFIYFSFLYFMPLLCYASPRINIYIYITLYNRGRIGAQFVWCKHAWPYHKNENFQSNIKHSCSYKIRLRVTRDLNNKSTEHFLIFKR